MSIVQKSKQRAAGSQQWIENLSFSAKMTRRLTIDKQSPTGAIYSHFSLCRYRSGCIILNAKSVNVVWWKRIKKSKAFPPTMVLRSRGRESCEGYGLRDDRSLGPEDGHSLHRHSRRVAVVGLEEATSSHRIGLFWIYTGAWLPQTERYQPIEL